MKKQVLFVWLALVVLALSISISSGAMAQLEPMLHLSPWPGPYGGEIIEVPPGDIETLYFHLESPFPTGYYHVLTEPSFHWETSNATGKVDLLTRYVQPSMEIMPSQWYRFGEVRVDGIPSTYFRIQIDLTLQGPTGGVVTLWSNDVNKHITPEPSSMLALGTGLIGVGGLLFKRRRSS